MLPMTFLYDHPGLLSEAEWLSVTTFVNMSSFQEAKPEDPLSDPLCHMLIAFFKGLPSSQSSRVTTLSSFHEPRPNE